MQHTRTLQIPFSVQGLAIVNTFKCTIQNRFCVASSDSCFKFKNMKGNKQSSWVMLICTICFIVLNRVVDWLLKFNLELNNCVYVYVLNQVIKFWSMWKSVFKFFFIKENTYFNVYKRLKFISRYLLPTVECMWKKVRSYFYNNTSTFINCR